MATKEPPIVDESRIDARLDRLHTSCLSAAVYAAPPLFVVILVVLLAFDRGVDEGILMHVLTSLFKAVCCTVMCAVAVAGCLLYMLQVQYKKTVDSLCETGDLVRAKLVGLPSVYGGDFMRYTVGGALGVLWGPLAPMLDTKLPVYRVAYEFEHRGKRRRGYELFFGDERPVLDPDDDAWVLVDPRSEWRRYMLREEGSLLEARLGER